MSGLVHAGVNDNEEVSTDSAAILESRSYRIVNDDGAWTGSSTFVQAGVQAGDSSLDGPPMIARDTGVLVGEGAYEGLTAFMTGDYRAGSSGEGVIFGIAVPPTPDVQDAPTG